MAQFCMFSEDLKTFAQISSGDGRLRLFNTMSGKERKRYTDKNHLTRQPVCSAWKAAAGEQLGCCAVGYSDGAAVVWDLSRGVIASTFDQSQISSVPSDLVFSNDAQSLFIASAAPDISRCSAHTGKLLDSLKGTKKGISKLAMNPKLNVVAAGGNSIRLIDCGTGRQKKLQSTFSGGVGALTFSPCGRFLISSSRKTREIIVFDVRAEGGLDPMQVIPVNLVPARFDAKTVVDAIHGEVLEILCLYRSDAGKLGSAAECSGGCIIQLSTSYQENRTKNLDSVIIATQLVAGSAPILCGTLGSAGDREQGGVLIALEIEGHPVFQHVPITGADGRIVKSVALDEAFGRNGFHAAVEHQRDDREVEAESSGDQVENGLVYPSVKLNGDNKGATRNLEVAEVLGPQQTGGKKRPQVQIDSESVLNGTETGGGNVHLQFVESKKMRSEQAAEAVELTLQQRLESLSGGLVGVEDEILRQRDRANRETAHTGPTSDSLTVLLEQALQANDNSLFEQCVASSDPRIIEETVRSLSAPRVLPLVKKLFARFEKRPSRANLVTLWLMAVARYHTGLLVNIVELSSQAGGFVQLMEQRMASYSRLASITGRLDLILSQGDRNNSGSSGGVGGDATWRRGDAGLGGSEVLIYTEK